MSLRSRLEQFLTSKPQFPREEPDAIGKITLATLGGCVIGFISGGYVSFWHELPNIPKSVGLMRSALINVGFLGKYVASFGALGFTFQFTKEAVNSFYDRPSMLADVLGGVNLGILSGLLTRNPRGGLLLGSTVATFAALTSHYKMDRSQKLLEISMENRLMIEKIKDMKANENEERRERARLNELEAHYKL